MKYEFFCLGDNLLHLYVICDMYFQEKNTINIPTYIFNNKKGIRNETKQLKTQYFKLIKRAATKTEL